jgi:hypothetical protein
MGLLACKRAGLEAYSTAAIEFCYAGAARDALCHETSGGICKRRSSDFG